MGCPRWRQGPGQGVVLAIALSLSPRPTLAGAARPDPLPDEDGCVHYRGTPQDANDPTQRFELMVCTSAEGVRAKVQTSSLVSGWSVRQSVGSWDASGQTLTLAETRFLESRPEAGWRFCLIDELALTRTERGLSGTYVSEACDDRAKLELERLAPANARSGPQLSPPELGPTGPEPKPASEPKPGPEPTVPGTEPKGPKPRADDASSGCSCHSEGRRAPPLALLLLPLLGVGLRRKKSEGHSVG